MAQDEVSSTLVDLGFTVSDARVYVFLAKKGPLKASTIAKSLKIRKQTLYPILKKLERKGIVNESIEHPARFSAAPFENVLDLFISSKIEEARFLQRKREKILSEWNKLYINQDVEHPPKFTVIEGTTHALSKIKQMVAETKKKISIVLPVSELLRTYRSGLFDVAFSHTLTSPIECHILTEGTSQNVNAVKTLLKNSQQAGIAFKGRTPKLGLPLSPRMVIRDKEEAIVYITKQKDSAIEDETCLFTNCHELVQSFTIVFDELWRNATDLEKTVISDEVDTTVDTQVFDSEELASKKYEEILDAAEKEIIMLTSSEGLIEVGKKPSLLKNWSKKSISIKIMAPITIQNLEVANQLSKQFEVRHVPVSYLKTTIVDEKYLFQSRATFEETGESKPRFYTSHYTNNQEYISNRKKILTNLWKTSKPPSTVTLGKVTSFSKSNMNSRPSLLFQNTIKRIDGPIIVKEENDSAKSLTEKDIINLHLNAARHPETSFSGGITRYYGFVGQAIVRPPTNLDLPEMLFIFLHYEKNSRFGTDDILQVFIKQKSPSRSFLPVVYISDNPKKLDFHRETFAGCFLNDNFRLAKKDQIQIQMHGNNMFCGWTIEIPLIDGYILPPGSILLEAHGEVKPDIIEMHYPSGYKLWDAYNGIEAFVTYFHPIAKYSGPGTDGLILRDNYQELCMS